VVASPRASFGRAGRNRDDGGMSDVSPPASGSAPGPSSPARVHGDARRLAAGLRVAASTLAVPALLVGVGALVGFVVLGAIAAVALTDGGTIARWVLLGLAVVGLGVTASFLFRVRATWNASRDIDALASDIVGLVDLRPTAMAVLADLADLTSQDGGLRVVSRARALWRVLRRLDISEHTAGFDHARWFVPPDVGETWFRAQLVTWGGLGAWVLVPLITAARLAGWL
jgi:hypothetical protein